MADWGSRPHSSAGWQLYRSPVWRSPGLPLPSHLCTTTLRTFLPPCPPDTNLSLSLEGRRGLRTPLVAAHSPLSYGGPWPGLQGDVYPNRPCPVGQLHLPTHQAHPLSTCELTRPLPTSLPGSGCVLCPSLLSVPRELSLLLQGLCSLPETRG